ncbi:MAG TPA: nucleotidyltransferase family protein [Actinomycetota bacterium]
MISGIVLAGGTSSRLGRPKQLLDLEGRPVLQHVVDAAAAAGLDEIVVVLGHMADEIAAAIDLPPGARTCLNPRYASGQSTSLEAGLDAADPASEAAVVLLGDQPRIGAEVVRAVVDRFRESGARVVRAWYGGRPAHPVLFARSVWDALRTVEGDRGARELLKAHPDWEVRLEAGPEVPSDLDTWEDYERLKAGPTPPV